MKREIKFRAWIKSEDESLMVYPKGKSDYMIICNGDGFAIVYDMDEYVDDEEFEIMQFTGLTDKNGKEIYEGDVLSLHSFYERLGSNLGVEEAEAEGTFEVVYNNDCVCFDAKKIKSNVDGWTLFIDSIEDWEVIGNIHENPELL